MNITERRITVRELTAGYADSGDAGVTALAGDLDVRPPYQREFVYDSKRRAAVIDTLLAGLPLNVMYWAARDTASLQQGEPGYEVMDGQQRTISVAQYVDGDFSHDGMYFHSLAPDTRERILDYELLVYVCEGTESEKLSWFRTINIAGMQLTDQELRNAVYAGTWLADAKGWFSKPAGPAAQNSDGYVKGSPIRQDLLQLALKWVVARDDLSSIEEYMSAHQHDPNANDLWMHWQSVIAWAKLAFPKERKELTSVDWGRLYLDHGQAPVNGAALELRVAKLMADEDVTKKVGIYEYVLSGRERLLSIRAFTKNQKREAYERQQGICPGCDEHFELVQMQGDHIVPWSQGGRTVSENCQMLCVPCNNDKSDGS